MKDGTEPLGESQGGLRRLARRKSPADTGRGNGAPPARGERHAAAVLRFAAEAVLDRIERGVVILDGEARLLFANAAARRLLEAGAPIMPIGERRIALSTLDAQRRLNAYLASHRESIDRAMTLRVSGNGWRRPCRIVVTPLASPELAALLGASESMHVLFVYEFESSRGASPQMLREVYGLTVSEAQVAMLIFEGCSVRDAATRAGVSVHTVRTHLKHTFAKCGVASQTQLMRLLALGPGTY